MISLMSKAIVRFQDEFAEFANLLEVPMPRDIEDDRQARPVTPVTREVRQPDANPDPITGAPGSHPIGTGVGAAAAGVAGAALGSVVPGVGTVVGGATGAVIGAVFGGLAGKGIAEAIDPTAEEAYWRSEYTKRPYYNRDYSFDSDYAPAYMYGYEVRANNPTTRYDDLQDEDLRSGWERAKTKSRLKYDEAKHAMRDAWDRWDSRND